MYLVYIGNVFFGSTYSKKVADAMRRVYPTAHSIHIDNYSDDALLTGWMGSDRRIKVHFLTDKLDRQVPVVTTEAEIEEATLWINRIIMANTFRGKYDTTEVRKHMPSRLMVKLGRYFDFEAEQFVMCDGDVFELTFEGYLMYLSAERGANFARLQKDLCLLPDFEGW